MAEGGPLEFRFERDRTAEILYVSGELDIASAPGSSEQRPELWTDKAGNSASMSAL